MIITEQKDLEEILAYLGKSRQVYLVGCGSCATAWHTGGEQEVKEMAQRLTEAGKEVIGWTIVEEPCDERKVKRDLIRPNKAKLAQAEAVLVMSCGAGVGTVANCLENKPIYPALDSLYLARVERLTKSDERCVLCGECILAYTGGICPVATCPKGLLNGPCGGVKDGRCEVDLERECTWVQIFHKMASLEEMDKLSIIQQPKNNAKAIHPRRREKAPVKS